VVEPSVSTASLPDAMRGLERGREGLAPSPPPRNRTGCSRMRIFRLAVSSSEARSQPMPIIITKMGRGYSFIFEMPLAIAFKHPNIYFDVVQATPAHIERAVEELGADQIMFGTDWSPTCWAEAGDIYKKKPSEA
jgi:Amidohydrolase